MARTFFRGHEYSQYLASGEPSFKEDIFYQMKCPCIEQSKFEECSCPTCTEAMETVRDWDRQRKQWFKDAGDGLCSCGACAANSPYRQASRAWGKLRSFLHAPCGKCSLDDLIISKGPKSCEKVEMYRRQCCRVPLPELKDALAALASADEAAAVSAQKHQAAAEARGDKELDKAAKAAQVAADSAKAKAEQAAFKAGGYTLAEVRSLANCDKCGWDKCMPRCPIEWDNTKPATWKEWRPRIEADGKSYQKEMRTIEGTREGLMLRLKAIFTEGDPHAWVDSWQTHQRHMVYATFESNELCISTDFSAQFDHKCAWTLTCEHPPRSNQAVYVVTHSPRTDDTGERVVTTDIWRIFSEVKGDSLFHNTALAQIVEFYKERLDLERVHVFTDGCRGQYKGKRNFCRIASFPSEHQGVHLLHHFAASHHFKGPHDAYGKDPKFLGRMAERHQRVRLATTHNLYTFCIETMPAPKKLTTKDIIATMPVKPATELERLPPEQLPEHLKAQQTGLTTPLDPPVVCQPCMHTGGAAAGGDGGGVSGSGEGGGGEHEQEVMEEAPCDEATCEEGQEEEEAQSEAAESQQDEGPGAAELEREEEASDSEAEEGGAGDFEFEFDSTGASHIHHSLPVA